VSEAEKAVAWREVDIVNAQKHIAIRRSQNDGRFMD